MLRPSELELLQRRVLPSRHRSRWAEKRYRLNTARPQCAAGRSSAPADFSNDPTYPAWRAGANSATSFHTDADLDVGGLTVPKGDYTIYAWVADPDNWQLIINKDVGQWGLSYDAKKDVGRVKMTMSKPPASIEMYKMTLSATGPKSAKLQLEWEHHIASVSITAK